MKNLLEMEFNTVTFPRKNTTSKVRLSNNHIYLPANFCIENGIMAGDKYAIRFVERETILLYRSNEKGFKLNKTGGNKSRTCELIHKNLCTTLLKIFSDIGIGDNSKSIIFQEKKTKDGIELRPIKD